MNTFSETTSSLYFIGLQFADIFGQSKGVAKILTNPMYTKEVLEKALEEIQPQREIHCGGGFEESRANHKKACVVKIIRLALEQK